MDETGREAARIENSAIRSIAGAAEKPGGATDSECAVRRRIVVREPSVIELGGEKQHHLGPLAGPGRHVVLTVDLHDLPLPVQGPDAETGVVQQRGGAGNP